MSTSDIDFRILDQRAPDGGWLTTIYRADGTLALSPRWTWQRIRGTPLIEQWWLEEARLEQEAQAAVRAEHAAQ